MLQAKASLTRYKPPPKVGLLGCGHHHRSSVLGPLRRPDEGVRDNLATPRAGRAGGWREMQASPQ